MKCPICKKPLEEDGLFWLYEQEYVNRLLESRIVWRKICSEHEDLGLDQFAALIGKRYNGIKTEISLDD
jgi:hypothetical protein